MVGQRVPHVRHNATEDVADHRPIHDLSAGKMEAEKQRE
jgi:hypothetical protein